MNLGSLSNVLAALVGFVSIMLMLSLIVTGVAETVSSLTGMRWRSGRRSLIRFVRDELGIAQADATELADRIYRLPDVKGKSGWDALSSRLTRVRGARAPLELGLPEVGRAAAGKNNGIVWDAALLERLRARMSDDYSRWMKTTSFLLSFVVAFALQVSAVKLVGDLSVSEEMRAKALELVTKDAVAKAPPQDFEARVRAALKELETKFPGASAALEEVSGVGDTVTEVVTELSLVLKDQPDRDALLKTFREILDRQDQAQSDAAQAAVLDRLAHLGAIDIRLLDDLSFYRGPDAKQKIPHLLWSNILGVLMTGILLTFGAPFWYEKLRGLQVLQNRLGDVVKKQSPTPVDDPPGGAAKKEVEVTKPPGKASTPP